MTRRKMSTLFLLTFFTFSLLTPLFGAEGPLVYILPRDDKAIIILGDIPRNVHSFQVFRKEKKQTGFISLTPGPIQPVQDPLEAMELMGDDVSWIARRMGTIQPAHLWRRLTNDRVMAATLCLISPGLRFALGRMFIDKTVTPKSTYSYRVVLLDSREREIKKIEKTITIKKSGMVDKPRNLTAKDDDGVVTLTWDYPEYRGSEKDLTTGFYVYRSSGVSEKIKLTPAPVLRIEGALEYKDRDVKTDTSYIYYVAAVDLTGTTSEMIQSKPITPRDTKKPLVPMGLTAVDKKDGVLLVWQISPELDVVSYNVYKSRGIHETFQKITTTPLALDEPRFVDTKAERGIAQYYRVSALDRSGNESAFSGPATIVPYDPDPPGEIQALTFTLDEKKRYITLTWQPLKDKDLAGYFIYRGKDKESLIRITGDPVPRGKNPFFKDEGYKQKGLTPGEEFVYGVAGIDTSSNQGAFAYVNVFVPDNKPPSPPYSFSARTTKEGFIRLGWQPSLAGDVTGHRVYRQSKQEKFRLIKELKKEATEWIDEEVTKGIEYFYKMTEVDSSGNESDFSPTVHLIPLDMIPPLPPEKAEARFDKRGIRISWEGSLDTDVKGYHLFRADYSGARWKQINSAIITTFQYTDSLGKKGNVYGIASVDSSGNLGEKLIIPLITETTQEDGKRDKK
ncbi:MAG: hypothetical protein JXJ04_09235 [Spirochaetales bacterium]|nr:hypothetical protein [Spirochaetales bacterium]